MYDRKGIREGMTVYSQDGEKLGKVFSVGDDAFQIEKGLFFPRDYVVRYDTIADVQGHDIILNIHKEALRPLGEEVGAPAMGTLGGRGIGREGAEEPKTRY